MKPRTLLIACLWSLALWAALILATLVLSSVASAAGLSQASALVHKYAPSAVVQCDPTLGSVQGDYGLTTTYFDGSPSLVQLDSSVCLGMSLFNTSWKIRRYMYRVHPALNIEASIGLGVLVTLHEAQHARGVLSESQAECYAMKYAKPMLANDPEAWIMAQQYDAELPPNYHGGVC